MVSLSKSFTLDFFSIIPVKYPSSLPFQTKINTFISKWLINNFNAHKNESHTLYKQVADSAFLKILNIGWNKLLKKNNIWGIPTKQSDKKKLIC